MKQRGLLFTGLLAVITIVGMVTLLTQSPTGMQVIKLNYNDAHRAPVPLSNTNLYEQGLMAGHGVADECTQGWKDFNECCSRTCGDMSDSQNMFYMGCKNRCVAVVGSTLTPHAERYYKDDWY